MAGKGEEIVYSEGYSKTFQPRQYLYTFYSTPEGASDEEEFNQFVFQKVNLCFDKIGGKRLLEIGCGPCIQYAIPSSRRFEEIVLTEYLYANREEVEKWLENEEDAFNWNWMLRQYSEFEKLPIEDIAKRVRQRVKPPVLESDLIRDNVIEHDVGKFDAVFSSLCIEAACRNYTEFKTALKKCAGYLEQNGYILLVTVLEQNFYRFDRSSYFSCNVTAADLKAAVEEAGFVDVEMHVLDVDRKEYVSSDFRSVAVTLARKK